MRASRRTFVRSTLVGAALTGGVPGLGAAARPRAMGPEETAVLLAQYEAAADIAALLDYLHRDAAAIVPQAAIAGWYRDVWFPSGPGPITVRGTAFRDWTWEVTGVTYPGTAEVAFTQSFADGSVANDIVRLVEDAGIWHWFFGRTRAFVNEQIAAYAPGSPLLPAVKPPQTAGSAPYGVAALVGLSEDAFLALAPDAAGTIARSPRVPERSEVTGDGRGESRVITYYNDPHGELYPVGVVGTFTPANANDELAYLESRAASVASPWGGALTPEILQAGVDGTVHYQLQREFASEAVGNATNLSFTRPGLGIVYVIGAVDPSNLAALAEAMVARARRRGA